MTAIAIDYWDKRCWIALEIENIAIPKEIVLRVNIIKTLEKYFKKYKEIDTIILGLPYDLYWLDKTQLNKTLEFQRELNNKFAKKRFKIIWVDERFSSFEAENVLNSLWEKDKHWKKDAISAAIILETYLNNKEKYV